MTKVLWHSNAPWSPTGYGMQTRLFAPLLAQRYELAISSFYGLEGDRLNWEGIPVFPGLGGEFGNDYLVQNAARFFGGPREGIVLTLLDVWVLNPDVASQLDMACWVPVDHSPAPPMVREFFNRSGAVPIAMSRFGQRELAEFDPLYVPHGVDLDVYKPHDQAEVRDQLGADKDAFLVGMVAANKGSPSRKCFAQALQAFAAFRQRHDDAVLYLHTDMTGDEDLIAMKDGLRIPDEAVRMADQYRINLQPLPSSVMSMLYSTFDVLLNPAAGEGFGITVAEAQACGVPTIVSDFSAMQEVCGAGWKVPCQPRWSPQRSWQVDPSVDGIVAALEECYGLSDAERYALSEQARQHVGQYGLDVVLNDHFLPAMDEVEQRLGARKPVAVAA